MIHIFTGAYNAEKTLDNAVKSILNQTYTNFRYYILDNGSIDSTKKIIEKYANQDGRIIPVFKDSNRRGRFIEIMKDIFLENSILTTSYFACLDADDEYAPNFLEKMLGFIQENNLEVASCGTDWINEKTGEIIKKKVLEKNIILEGQNFADQFPIYRNFMVTVWGCIYSLDLLQKCDFNWYYNTVNFSDTAFCMEVFHRAKRAGVLGDVLHKYYISPKTSSYKYNPDWFQACKYLNEISREYLLDYGEISNKNEDYLCVLFLINIKYILPRIQQANISLSEKLFNVRDIFADDMTQHILKHWEEVGIHSSKLNFLHEIEEWIYSQDSWEKSHQTVEEIIKTMNI